jgi:vitamin K-dependent gamma-carboxylase
MLKHIFKSIDNSPLIVFRILFGFLIACESFGAILTGWVKAVFLEPQFTFSFIGFEWLQPLPNNLMYVYFILMGCLGLLIMIGYRYVIAMVGFTIMWAGVYFMQKSSYNNHYYLLLLISFCMVFFPANKYASLDVKLKITKEENSMPYWISLVFITQIILLYFYASIAKLYPDWLNGTFTKNLLQGTTTRPFFLNLFSQPWFYMFIAYAGILFDLIITPLLLIKKTRNIAFLLSIGFHLFNAVVLHIGIFPFFALSFILFFYEPETIRNLFFKNKLILTEVSQNASGASLLKFIFIPFLIIQLLLPLRHHFIKGDVLWTEEGHRLSWRMMLRERSGYLIIKIVDNKTKNETIYNYHKNLSSKQARQLPTKPDFIWQYCQRIKKEYFEKDISIYLDCKNSVNRGPYKTLIDPETDFVKAEWNHFKHNDWILLN